MKILQVKIIFVLFLFLIQGIAINSSLSLSTITVNKSVSSNSTTTTPIVIQDPHTVVTNIVLLNYANITNLINGIAESLPPTLTIQNGAQTIVYTMIYHFIFPNFSFITNFTNFINSVSTPNSSTVDINQTALKYQAVNNTVQSIFINENGTSIDGLAVENWLWTNGQQFKSASTSYQIFLLNLTHIPGKYWFNIPEPDEVTHQQRQEWRLEWDYPPFGNVNNYNVKFPYPGYSGHYPMYYLDPSAFNWYLNWTRIWRNVPIDTHHREYLNSFKEYVNEIGGLTNQSNQILAGSFIGDWLNEIVSNLFVFNPLNYVSSPSSLTLQVAVITDENATNTYPDLHWIINNTIVKDQLQRVLPNSVINVQTNFTTLTNHPNLQNLLDKYKLPPLKPAPIPNYTYYDGYGLFTPIQSLDSEFFSPSSSAMTLRAYILILNNASFAGANWNGGGLFTGLGGGGRLLILNEVDRLFFNRTSSNPVPKESLSKVLIHEAGHAIGFPHPFNELTNSYASDFLSEVMGYYSSTANYSTLFIDNFQRLSLESKINLVYSNLQQLVKTNLSSAYLSSLLYTYYDFLNAYHTLDFQTANVDLNQLQNLLSQQINLESGGVKPPIFVTSPNNGFIFLGSNITLKWQAYDLNPLNYYIFVNDTQKFSGNWSQSPYISFNFDPPTAGSYNISLVVYNKFYLNSMKSVFIFVKDNNPSQLDPIFAIILPISIATMVMMYKKKYHRS